MSTIADLKEYIEELKRERDIIRADCKRAEKRVADLEEGQRAMQRELADARHIIGQREGYIERVRETDKRRTITETRDVDGEHQPLPQFARHESDHARRKLFDPTNFDRSEY